MLVGNPPLELQAVPAVKNPFASAGGTRYAGLIPGWGRFPGEGHGHPLQCSCLENPMDRGARRATAHGAAESDATKHARTQVFQGQVSVGVFPLNWPRFLSLCLPCDFC